MADEAHLARLKEGVVAWNAWREAHPEIAPDLSRVNLSDVDLRGAGVPDQFIEYMRSLLGKAIDYYSCFSSYSSKQAFASSATLATSRAGRTTTPIRPPSPGCCATSKPSLNCLP